MPSRFETSESFAVGIKLDQDDHPPVAKLKSQRHDERHRQLRTPTKEVNVSKGFRVFTFMLLLSLVVVTYMPSPSPAAYLDAGFVLEATAIENEAAETTAEQIVVEPRELFMEQQDQKLPRDNQKRKLPDPFRNGGIIYFVHIPKSGGTTIRAFLESRTKLTIARKDVQYRAMISEMERLLHNNGTSGQIHAFETHASSVPPYVGISPRVKEWKAAATVANIPFFAFTLLREPKSFQISSFNYYYLGRRKRLANDTVHDFCQTLQMDPQCEFLLHGGGFTSMLDGYVRNDWALKSVNARVNDADCDRAYQTLFDDMDWIGTTEDMQRQTLPLLNYLTQTKGLPAPSNKSPKYMTLSRLNQTHLEQLEFSTRRDKKWYDATKAQYPFDLWNQTVYASQ